MTYRLIIGNKNYSSWSLRAWLLFKVFEIPFEEQVVPLFTPEFQQFKQDWAPLRSLPALSLEHEGGRQLIWDSLAIAELLHERHPEAGIWPGEPGARATARCLAAEMHSSFGALRDQLPMHLKRRHGDFEPSPEVLADTARIAEIWRWASEAWGGDGPYLFGSAFTAADAFFVPVATRFRTYAIALDARSQAYCQALLDHPATRQYLDEALAEPWVITREQVMAFS